MDDPSPTVPNMPLGTTITPDAQQAAAFRAAIDHDDGQPVILLNLLAFDDAEGQATYTAGYGTPVLQLLADVGAKQIFAAKVNRTLIGDQENNQWDQLWLTWYPNRTAVKQMVEGQAYGEAHRNRESGLARTLVLDITEMFRDFRPS